jgi:hypothetical protein
VIAKYGSKLQANANVRIKGTQLRGKINKFYSDPAHANWDIGSPKFIEVIHSDGTIGLYHPNQLKMRH